MQSLEILSEEPHFLTLNKPAGIQSQAAEGVPCVQRMLSLQLAERDQHSGKPFVGLPHRLDRVTSGVMLIARNQRALRQFNAQFQSRKVHKYYLAVFECDNDQRLESEVWSDNIRKIPDVAKAEILPTGVDAESLNAKHAELAVLPFMLADHLQLALIQLRTGRMHQIRVQAASRQRAIVGDQLYGAEQQFGPEEPTFREAPIALHALRLEFRHPKTGTALASTAPPPSRWNDLPEQICETTRVLTSQSQTDSASSWLSKFP
ncbi:MAG: RluA family pseudouridine synthase [Planctomycetota bacterium]